MKLFILILCLCLTTSLCQKTYHENEIWGKPCLEDDDSVPSSSKSAEDIIIDSTWVFEQLDTYKDEFILKLEKRYKTFSELVENAEHNKMEWLRNFFWFSEEILPKDKVLGKQSSEKTIEEIKTKIKGKGKVMTKIDATLKFILRNFNLITKLDLYSEIMKVDLNFKRKLEETVTLLRKLTCSMNKFTKSLKKEIPILVEDFLPQTISHHEVGLMLRDTFNYLEYINQLFESLLIEHPDTCDSCSLLVEPDSSESTKFPFVTDDFDPNVETPLWGNPCNYFNATKPYREDEPQIRVSEYAHQVITAIIKAQTHMEYFRTIFAKDLYHDNFQGLVLKYQNKTWLQAMPWYRYYVLPLKKKLSVPMHKDFFKGLMPKRNRILPKIHKGAKMILSGLRMLSYNAICFKHIKKNKKLRPTMEKITNQFRRVVCKFSDYLNKNLLPSEFMYRTEEPNLEKNGTPYFLVYRDALIYLQYIHQLFDRLSKLPD